MGNMRALVFSGLILVAGCGDGDASTTQGTSSGGASAAGAAGAGAAPSGGAGGAAAGGSGGAPVTGGSGGAAAGGSGGAGATGGAGGSGGAAAGGGGGATTTSSTTTTLGMPGPCTWGDDCGGGYYCDAPGCGAGNCIQKPVPAGLSPILDPVCGCDGLSYWNAEIAASQGISIASAGACAAVVPCGPGAPCPAGTKCDREVADKASCDPRAPGQCLGIPLSCPLDGPKGRACSNDQCELRCSLIQSQNPWFDDPTCN